MTQLSPSDALFASNLAVVALMLCCAVAMASLRFVFKDRMFSRFAVALLIMSIGKTVQTLLGNDPVPMFAYLFFMGIGAGFFIYGALNGQRRYSYSPWLFMAATTTAALIGSFGYEPHYLSRFMPTTAATTFAILFSALVLFQKRGQYCGYHPLWIIMFALGVLFPSTLIPHGTLLEVAHSALTIVAFSSLLATCIYLAFERHRVRNNCTRPIVEEEGK